MPIDYKNYPENWKEISNDIRFNRAGSACECLGECGSHKDPWCGGFHGHNHHITGSKVVLTVAHLDHDTKNNDYSNLKAMCQRCHLNYDKDHHARNAAKTRRKKRIAAGQLVLL